MTASHQNAPDQERTTNRSGVFGVIPPGDVATSLVTQRVAECTYLVAENTPRYRIIMRYFLEQYERSHDWLKEEQIRAAVAARYDASYDDVQCRRDLEALSGWGNLKERHDSYRPTSMEDWQRAHRMYHAKPFAIDIEQLLVRSEQPSGNRGSLDANLLEALWSKLTILRAALLAEIPSAPSEDYLVEHIWGPWLDAVGRFDTLRENANRFHHVLREQQPQDIFATDAFDEYKDILLDHLRGFVDRLNLVGERIKKLTARWRADGSEATLIYLLAYYESTYRKLDGTTVVTYDGALARVGLNVRRLSEWFAPGQGCDTLNDATARAILSIAHYAERRAFHATAGSSRRRDLERLARAFAACDDVGTAHRLAARVFCLAVPRHLRGDPDAAPRTDHRSAWLQPAEIIALQPVRRGRRARTEPLALRDRREKLRALSDAKAASTAADRARWDALFVDDVIDLAKLDRVEPESRRMLLDVIGKCLLSSSGEGQAPGGQRIRLVPVEGGTPAALRAIDGTMLTPAYALVRMVPVRGRPGKASR